MAGSGVLRFRWTTALAWLAAGAALLPLAPGVEDRLEVSARIPGSESAAVDRLLAERFESPFARGAILVLSGVPAPDDTEGRAVLDRVAQALAERPEVEGVLSYRDQQDAYFLGSGGRGTFLVVGLDAPDGRVDRLLPGLRGASAALQAELRARHPQATLRWTGEAAINYDLWRSSADDTHRAERRTLPITFALLLFAFGSVAAALVTVASGALAVGLALGLVALAARLWPLSILAVNVVSMIGLALGIDYALLTVSRFREARGRRRAGGSRGRCGAARGRHGGPFRPDGGRRLPRAPPLAPRRAALGRPRRVAGGRRLRSRGGDAAAGDARLARAAPRARPPSNAGGRRWGSLARLEPVRLRPTVDRPARGRLAAASAGGAGRTPQPARPARRLAAAVDRVGTGDRRPARDGARGGRRVAAGGDRAAGDDDRPRARGLGRAAPPRGAPGGRSPGGPRAVSPRGRRGPR